jgi:hypothetical protein
MIAYRAESALAGGLVEYLQRGDDKRALLRSVFVTPANLQPDYEQKTLTVELHRLGRAVQDAAVAQLCAELTPPKPSSRSPTYASSTAKSAQPDSGDVWGSVLQGTDWNVFSVCVLERWGV